MNTMNLITISNFNILLVLINVVYSESDDSDDQSHSRDQDDYDDSKTHYHRLRYSRKPKYPASNMMHYDNGYDYNYNEENCVCSCDKCHLDRLCCREYCMNCQAMNQPSLFYLHYPVPQYPAPAPPPIIPPAPPLGSPLFPNYQMDIPNMTTEIIFPTTQSSTTELSTETTPIRLTSPTETESPTPPTTNDPRREAVIEVSDIYINENIRNNDAKYILTSLRRTKPYWQANRVVPIPNNLAEKLMTQMKDDTKPSIRRVYS